MEFKNPTRFAEDLIKNNFNRAVDLGLVPGISSDAKFGHCPDAGAVVTDIWENGLAQPVYIFPVDAGETIQARSDNLADTTETTIVGLDVNGLVQSQVITLNGTTPVPIPGVWRAINRAYNSNGTVFVGDIFIEGDGVTSSNIFAQISADDQQTSQAIYMVPADQVVVINNFSTAVNRSGGTSVSCLERLAVQPPGGVFRTQIRYGLMRQGVSNISSDLVVGIPVPPLSKIKISAEPSVAATDVSAEWSMHLHDTGWLGADAVAAIQAAWQ